VKLGERLPDLEFWNLIFLNEDALEVRHAFLGFGKRLIQLVLGNAVARNQKVEFGWILFCNLFEIEKSDAECFRDFRDGFFILSCESCAAFFVEELKNSHQVFVVGNNRVGQHLFRLESCPFVVRTIMKERGVDALQFGGVIGIRYAHWA